MGGLKYESKFGNGLNNSKKANGFYSFRVPFHRVQVVSKADLYLFCLIAK